MLFYKLCLCSVAYYGFRPRETSFFTIISQYFAQSNTHKTHILHA